MSSEHAARSGTISDSEGGGDSYDNIEPWLLQLHELPVGSAEHERLRQEIIGKCLPLGEHIARRYAGRGVEADDLVQIAAVGVILAVDRFDPTNGATFLSFALPTIMGEIRRYFRDSTWAVRVPRRTKELQQRLTPAISELMQRLGRQPTARELATHLDADLAEITQALIAGNGYSAESLDAAPMSSDDGDALASRLDRYATVDPGYALIDDSLTAGPLLAELPERERTILIMRYGEGRTQAEIAREIGVSQMQISRLLSRTLSDLRARAEGRGPRRLRVA
ncbi:SigB/SigF/SigG family RNA polymerase sigma factor [Nocardia yunnanensis]|uniref:SigB/SigF/SigG family RNA polymerase sigma factor n=1 Tax=Nocardia yunnanensis TaxID=2382165 RepID=A0A386ZM22_9NOCA|nr:SigB/SigF/SigG family RNA polymerase sigma factor [Nocardia yunnanensis]AYF77699.1 SigB/SigF/SigG family RNA polymerase sigma factor [Nocardia yunnanensis]